MRRFALVLLAACSGSHSNIAATLRFSDRSDADIARLISAAGGTDMFSAQGQVDGLSGSTDPCPAVAIAGDTVTITGGCTTKDGIQLAGSATLTNPAAWDPQIMFQYGTDSVYDFHQLAFTQQSFTTSYDGTFRITDGFTTWEADLTATMLGVAVRSELYYHCDQSSLTCDLDGSGLELAGVGGVQVSGSVHAGSAASADFALQGADRVTAHVAQGCVSWTLDGTSRGKTCP